MHLDSLYMTFWLRVEGYSTFQPQAKGYTTFHPGAKGYATFWFKAFPVQGRRAKRPQKLSSSELEPEVVSVPCPRYPMRPEGPMWGPKGPTMGMGGRGGVGWGAPKAPPYGIFHPLIIISPSLLSVRPLRAPIGLIN